MDILDYEICKCPCHYQKEYYVRHLVSCCYPCDFCGKLIVSYYHKTHIERCEKEYNEKTGGTEDSGM